MPQVTVIASKIHQENRLQVEVHPLIINHNVLNLTLRISICIMSVKEQNCKKILVEGIAYPYQRVCNLV